MLYRLSFCLLTDLVLVVSHGALLVWHVLFSWELTSF